MAQAATAPTACWCLAHASTSAGGGSGRMAVLSRHHSVTQSIHRGSIQSRPDQPGRPLQQPRSHAVPSSLPFLAASRTAVPVAEGSRGTHLAAAQPAAPWPPARHPAARSQRPAPARLANQGCCEQQSKTAVVTPSTAGLLAEARAHLDERRGSICSRACLHVPRPTEAVFFYVPRPTFIILKEIILLYTINPSH